MHYNRKGKKVPYLLLRYTNWLQGGALCPDKKSRRESQWVSQDKKVATHSADQEPPSKRWEPGGWMEPMFEKRNFNDDTVFKANTQALLKRTCRDDKTS